jgi:polyhydroxyalkanoate synthase
MSLHAQTEARAKPRAATSPRKRPVAANDVRPLPASHGGGTADAVAILNGSAVCAPLDAAARALDREVRASVGRATGSLSVASALLSTIDWAINLLVSPGKQAELQWLGWKYADDLAAYGARCLLAGPALSRLCVTPPARDRRFADDAWLHWPFNLLHQRFLLVEQWWAEATRGVAGVDRHHEELLSFIVRQLLDLASPGNVLWTNPVALRATIDEAGVNLLRGGLYAVDDTVRATLRLPPPGAERFIVGRDVAITPGKVVFRNRLIELLQYAPTTPQVHPQPVLLVPAWIMKYYILDLSPQNSLVKYLVDQGHTVFCISWKNPTAEDRGLGLEDYLQLGLFAALEAVTNIVSGRKVHALGYCLGGTLLAIGAAAMARDGVDRLASMSLLAAQTEFSEPGELGLFIDESQVNLLEAQMARPGYLAAEQMAGAFQLLRSYDLLWSRLVKRYLLGESTDMNDLMAWNADTTRMPARMHGEYLRQLFLHDDLAEGRFRVGGRPVSLGDVRAPVFLVGTVTDHVAPWRSVYKLHHLTPAEITFVLTSGGHNAGIVSPPGHPHRHYQLLTSATGTPRRDPDAWLSSAPDNAGSWWPAWHAWLCARSSPPIDPPPLGTVSRHLPAAPGHYVLER